jgi:tetratricopeptide (TPR) repeat protein
MKKTLLFLLLAAVFALVFIPAAAESPYTTWTMGPHGHIFMTQDAYAPAVETDLPVKNAEDMFITPDGTMYIADTGKGRILKLKDFQVIGDYGSDILEGPTGIYVDNQGTMYIADGGSNTVVILDKDGTLIKQFGKPTEPLFGADAAFLPRKIAVDARQNIYLVSEGSVNGLLQLNTNGNFIGYFGANQARMSLKMILQRTFLTKAQLAQFVKNEAASPSNLVIDKQALVYTVTAGTNRGESIHRFTISGKNIFPQTFDSNTNRDINVSDNGLVWTVDNKGWICEYDQNGALLFVFGAVDDGEQRLGTLLNPSAIDHYGDTLYVLDKDKNAVVTYKATAFAKKVHQGIGLYMDGFYEQAKPYFEEVLNYNGSFLMAYQVIADADFKVGDYASALTAYRYAEDRSGYSQAFWELRNVVLQKYLGSALWTILGLVVVSNVSTRLDKRYNWLTPAKGWLKGLQRFKLVDDFVFMFRFIKQPADSFYYIKKNERGSLVFAFILYAWVIVARILSLYLTGFPFNPYTSPAYIPLQSEVMKLLLGMVIWNVANYLISTITDGEGRVRDVIIGSAYSLFPYALFIIPIALVSRVLTFNEVFLVNFSMNIVFFWTGLMLFIMVKEVHNYSFWETVKNILLTLFTMGLFLLTGYILYVLFSQLFDFISAIIQEVGLRG